MGDQLMRSVMDQWPVLTHRQWRCLLVMARFTYDTPRRGKPARRYWGGHRRLLEQLGFPDTPAARRTLARLLQELVDVGALMRIGGSAPGRNAEYEVIVWPAADETPGREDQVNAWPPEPGDAPDITPAQVRRSDDLGSTQVRAGWPPEPGERVAVSAPTGGPGGSNGWS